MFWYLLILILSYVTILRASCTNKPALHTDFMSFWLKSFQFQDNCLSCDVISSDLVFKCVTRFHQNSHFTAWHARITENSMWRHWSKMKVNQLISTLVLFLDFHWSNISILRHLVFPVFSNWFDISVYSVKNRAWQHSLDCWQNKILLLICFLSLWNWMIFHLVKACLFWLRFIYWTCLFHFEC